MRKNLRSKILLCVLAGGVLAANTALAAEYTGTIKDDITFNSGDVVKVDDIGIDSSDKELTVTVNGNTSVNAENMTNDAIGIKIEDNSMLINGNDNAKLNITANGGERAVGIDISLQIPKETVINPDLEINVSNNLNSFSDYDGAYGIYAYSNTKFNGDINIEVNSDCNNEVSALNLSGDKIEFNGDVKAVINSTNDITKTSNYIAAAIHTSYGSETVFNKTVDLTFNANTVSYPIAGVISIISNPNDGNNILTFNDETKITVNNPVGMAVGVFCSGAATFDHDMDAIVNFRDDVYIDTNGEGINSVAILAQADSVVDISKAELSNTAENAVHGVIKGAIQSGTGINGDKGYVNLNFTGADSLIESDINIANDDAVADLALHDGAVWRPTGLTGGSLLTNLSMNEGVVEQNNSGTIGIRNYSGSGDINFKAKNTDNNGVLDFTNTGDVTIGTAEAGSSVNLGVSNNTVNTLDIEKTEENLNAIAEKIVYVANDGKLGGKVTVKEGLITPEASADLMFDGNSQGYVTNITGGNRTTQTMDAMKNLAATAIVAWRQEDSTLSQRLGELRESDGGQGIWVRMSRGEFEYDGEYKNQYNFFQMGYDWAAGSWHYGAAVSYNDGQTTYTHGDGENRSTSLSLYGTWLGDKGHYADIVLKQGRLSNDFDIYTEAGHTSGDYDAWGTSLSGEYGMKVDLDGGWYVTPQAQLTLMRIGGEDYTTNNGIKVNQDSLESAVGRVGFEVGKRISDSGSIYAKASLLHDFAGSADTYLSHKGLTNSYHQDIGDTWCEAGIGFNYKTSENSYVYADVVKTFGGDVETPWQWNAGMRWTF
jgi:outer membrane autotransporter protein